MKNLHLLATVCFMLLSFSPILKADEPHTDKHQTKSYINIEDINPITGEYILKGILNGNTFYCGGIVDGPRYFWNNEVNYLTIESPYCPNARWEVVSPSDLDYYYNDGVLTFTPRIFHIPGQPAPQIILKFISGEFENGKPFTKEFNTTVRFRELENSYL